ncbi:MAG: FAD-dependent oxidoreductase [Proteobacteria bacterium]|nr:FAD-dependent oxidoreductase [Pseudomonadota bacterium]
MNKKIAIVGGGIGGLTAAYLLNKKYDITLFEKENRIGGNAYTHKTQSGESLDIAVGAYSRFVSQNFLKLCKRINVKMIKQPSRALLSIHNLETHDGIYLTPLNLKGLMTQKFALYRSSARDYSISKTVLAMKKIIRLFDEGKLKGLSMAEAFQLMPELDKTGQIFLMSPLCLLSSMYYEEILKGPAEFFIGKIKAMRQFEPMPQMLGLYFPKNFTKSYVDALAANYPDKIIYNSNIKSIKRNNGNVTVKMNDGNESTFDFIVFACNADQALNLLENPTPDETRLLGNWKYKEGLMVVHKDKSKFPPRELCQSWTCLQSTRNGNPHFSISLCSWMFSPAVSNKCEFIGTQHPNFPINKILIDFKTYLRTPIYDFDSFKTIKELPSLNGKMKSYYCGSHFGFGLHDDAVTSAINVAKELGINW